MLTKISSGGVIHHTAPQTAPIGLDRLEKVATLVDKYDCARPLCYWGTCEFRTLLKETVKEPFRFLWPGYAFDEAHFFNGVSKFLVLHLCSGAPGEPMPPKDILSQLPEGLIGKNPC